MIDIFEKSFPYTLQNPDFVLQLSHLCAIKRSSRWDSSTFVFGVPQLHWTGNPHRYQCCAFREVWENHGAGSTHIFEYAHRESSASCSGRPAATCRQQERANGKKRRTSSSEYKAHCLRLKIKVRDLNIIKQRAESKNLADIVKTARAEFGEHEQRLNGTLSSLPYDFNYICKTVLQNVRVILTTLSCAGHYFLEGESFETVIIDEAAQAVERWSHCNISAPAA